MNIIQNFGSITAGQLKPGPSLVRRLALAQNLAVFDNGDHASSSHAGGMYIFISFPQTNPMWFQPNIFQPQTGIFQPQSININHKQSQTTIRYQSIFTPITINKYRPWFVDEGRIYIYIFIYSNSLLFQHIYNFYNAYTTYTTLIQEVYNAYITHTSTI